ncbi:MAG: hypothetical protein VX509_08025, partial [Verrucomicrobiota bacterium]|nr:hypothetical protein [Verrucomicrobiota bacterium]
AMMNIPPLLDSMCATVLQLLVGVGGVLGGGHQFGLEYDWLYWWCLAATLCTGSTFLIYFPAGLKQLKAVPASAPSEDQSRRLVRMDFEVDSSTLAVGKKKSHEEKNEGK